MPWMNNRGPDGIERAVSGFCYLSFGLIGLLYIILNGKGSKSEFFRFHFIQAIILGLAATLLSWTAQSFTMILTGVMGLFGSAGQGAAPAVSEVIGGTMGILSKIGFLVLLYGMLWAFLGKIAEIPFLSKLVRQQMR
jgi:uncharacterized membrane protein